MDIQAHKIFQESNSVPCFMSPVSGLTWAMSLPWAMSTRSAQHFQDTRAKDTLEFYLLAKIICGF